MPATGGTYREAHRALLAWLLPDSRPGYAAFRQRLDALQVIGHGRWGEGDLLFGSAGDVPDGQSPHAAVFAHGVVTNGDERLSITVHREAGGQIEVQFSGPDPEGIDLAAASRYCYSYWSPGEPGPATGTPVREVRIPASPAHVLAIASAERRLWLHDARSGVNDLLPHTAVYTALQRVRAAAHAKQVFDPAEFFSKTGEYADAALLEALRICNTQWRLLPPDTLLARPVPAPTFLQRIMNLLRTNGQKSHS